MIWRSLIFFNLVLLGMGHSATTSGKVELAFSQDPNVRKHLDYSGVVVWLEPASSAAVVPAASRHAEMLQKNKKFSPHVLAITVGTTVDFPNRDFIFHNAFSNYNGETFDIGLYPRSEEHTSELQSLRHLVCRLLLERGRESRDLHSFPTRRSSDL